MKHEQILITGANGQLGKALKAQYQQATALDSRQLDITNLEQLESIDWSSYTTIVNAAAYTAVDEAETPDGRRRAWLVNAHGSANLVSIALKHGLTLLHISTDYVFDGREKSHTESETFSPLGVYGQSKAAGDITAGSVPKHYILRASWVIGDGKNFVRTMIGLAQKGVSPTVVADQVGRPTFTSELVRVIDHALTAKIPFGTYNASNGGEAVSWAGLTRAVYAEMRVELPVTNTTTAEYFAGKPAAAPRPLNSMFDLAKLTSTGFTPRDWRENLKEYIEEETRA